MEATVGEGADRSPLLRLLSLRHSTVLPCDRTTASQAGWTGTADILDAPGSLVLLCLPAAEGVWISYPSQEETWSRRSLGAVALLLVWGGRAPAQQFPPGYVNPAPLLAAAAAEIGEANLRCITFSGAGYSGAVGQTFENAVNVDWPRIDAMANYTRTINWETGTSKETFDRRPGLNPASWKYGLGWQGGTPTQTETRQTHIVNGDFAWHIDGDGPPVAVPPELAEVYRLDLWLNPPGFIKAARLPGANPVAFWRWEQLEKGRDGNVVAPEKMPRGRDHDVREVPRGCHHQLAESDPTDQDHCERALTR